VRHPADRLPELGRHPADPPLRFADDDDKLTSRLKLLPPAHPSALRDAPKARSSADIGTRPTDGSRGHASDRPAVTDDAYMPKPPLWPNVARFRQLWAEHVRRWPDARGPERKHTDAERRRPDDPAGSWRGCGDQYLGPDANAEADHVIGTLQRCEPAVTGLLRSIERENKHGGSLVGLEHRLKGAERLKEKIADKMAVKPGSSPADGARGIADAVRYTFCFGEDNYVRGCDDVSTRLAANGYELLYKRNHWLSDLQYKGVNCRWRVPDGSLFELQFHTAESLFAKEQVTHPAYERARRPTTSRSEALALTAFQKAVCDMVTVPAGISDIADHNVRH
jgi:hypothetical protein